MKYKITRTSDWRCLQKPCSKAYQEGIGEFGEPLYVIDINTLDELNEVIYETGKCVIVSNRSIEIYDDYRE